MDVRTILFDRGASEVRRFCEANDIAVPAIVRRDARTWRFRVPGYYDRPADIHVCVEACAVPGTAGRSWSHPATAVDRTPYGVLLHELGHHVDVLRVPAGTRAARYWSGFSAQIRARSGEPPITTYCENDAEWFAEMFRLFVGNPDLLRLTRPATYSALIDEGLAPIHASTWEDRLADAPDRILSACRTRIDKARRLASAGRPERTPSLFDALDA